MMYFVTGNKGKFAEMKKAIPELKQIELDLPEVQSLDSREVIEAKLAEALKQTDQVCLLEDSSLFFDSLEGKLPGPLIKWFEEALGNDGIYHLATKAEEPGATFRVIIGHVDKQGHQHFFTGEQRGTLVEPRGDKDFGWGSIFQPDGSDKTYAEMEPDEKWEFSARAKAVEKLKEFWAKDEQ